MKLRTSLVPRPSDGLGTRLATYERGTFANLCSIYRWIKHHSAEM